MSRLPRSSTIAVRVGHVSVGGGAPVVVQAMTNTDTSDAELTAGQCLELAQAGAELVRVSVNTHEAALAIPEIRQRLDDAGCSVPLIGDFHYNGHVLLTQYPETARVLDKYRINPGNIGRGERRDERFAAICSVAAEHGKAIRIGVNGGSLDPDLVAEQMRQSTEQNRGKSSSEILGECMALSALRSTELALRQGLGEDRIVISCKSSVPLDLIAVYRDLAGRTRQALHLGLTEAGMGIRGLIWSASAMAVLLAEGIGDTIRVSLTPRPGGDRREEVLAARELLQALDLRTFSPTVTACPGCGRTTSATFQRLAERVEAFVREHLVSWTTRYEGVEGLRLAVMGCTVNGPGESKAANVGISLPGTGEAGACPVFVDGVHVTTLKGSFAELAGAFERIVEDYVASHYPVRGSSRAREAHEPGPIDS